MGKAEKLRIRTEHVRFHEKLRYKTRETALQLVLAYSPELRSNGDTDRILSIAARYEDYLSVGMDLGKVRDFLVKTVAEEVAEEPIDTEEFYAEGGHPGVEGYPEQPEPDDREPLARKRFEGLGVNEAIYQAVGAASILESNGGLRFDSLGAKEIADELIALVGQVKQRAVEIATIDGQKTAYANVMSLAREHGLQPDSMVRVGDVTEMVLELSDAAKYPEGV